MGTDTVTVGGESATLAVAANGGGDISPRAEIWQLELPAGTLTSTEDVAVTFSAGASRCGISVDILENAASAIHDSASSGAATMSDTIDVPKDGAAIFIAFSAAGAAARTHTWTGVDENSGSDVTIEGDNAYTAASKEFATEQTGLTVTCTPSGSTGRRVMLGASWGPG